MWALCWFLIDFLFLFSNIYLFVLPFCVFFLIFPLFFSFLFLSFELNLIYFFVFSPFFRYPLYYLHFVFPSYSLNYFSLRLFFSSHIFTATFSSPYIFSFIFHLTFVYLSLFPLFPNLFSSFSLYIFILFHHFSLFTFSHSRPSCFILSLHKSRNPR